MGVVGELLDGGFTVAGRAEVLPLESYRGVVAGVIPGRASWQQLERLGARPRWAAAAADAGLAP